MLPLICLVLLSSSTLASEVDILPSRSAVSGADQDSDKSQGENEVPAMMQSKHCKHGTFDDTTQSCHCFEGWATAGITDTLDFLEGVCEQFHCQSDKQCQEILQIPEAACPVPNWNCYCSFKWAFWNSGHGYETDRNGGAECMGVMYAFSIWSTEWLCWFMQEAWKLFPPLVVLTIPFGRKRSICDHHTPSIWNAMRRCCGIDVECTGTCIMQEEYTFDTLKDDLAWSLYVLDLCVWLYLFFMTLYVVLLFVWSVVLWAAVCVMLVLACLVGACGMCGEGMAGGCDLMGCQCGGGDCCGECCMINAAQPMDNLYYGGVFPYDPFWGYGGYGNGTSDCGDCCGSCGGCCRPLALLIYVFPILPENAWGGLVGRYIFGTHKDTPPDQMYQGGSDVIEFFRMGWRIHADLHGNSSWRSQVFNFLSGDGQPQLGAENSQTELLADQRSTTTDSDSLTGGLARVIRFGVARVFTVDRTFDLEEDRCVPSSYEDYLNNTCWICQDSNDEWDLWLSCRHLFCKKCSSEMLHRRMPCPLCRVASTSILRGFRGDCDTSQS